MLDYYCKKKFPLRNCTWHALRTWVGPCRMGRGGGKSQTWYLRPSNDPWFPLRSPNRQRSNRRFSRQVALGGRRSGERNFSRQTARDHCLPLPMEGFRLSLESFLKTLNSAEKPAHHEMCFFWRRVERFPEAMKPFLLIEVGRDSVIGRLLA